MSSPLMTDEEVEMADKENTVTSKKSLEEQMKESLKNEDSIIKEDLVEEPAEEVVETPVAEEAAVETPVTETVAENTEKAAE